VLGSGELPDGGGRPEPGGRIDEDDLAGTFAQQGQHGLEHGVVTADIRAIKEIEIGQRGFIESAVGNRAAAEHQNVDAAEIFLDALAKGANVLIFGEINRASVPTRAERLNLFRDVFQKFAAARHEANLGTVAGQGESNRFADAAAGSGHYGNLILQTFHDWCRGLRRLMTRTTACRIPLVQRRVAE
jgi:hypothetical protein